tara:strand:+ start:401 stop:2017 length:1617 start_codon:yes stop_codon:yes gene_type:complete
MPGGLAQLVVTSGAQNNFLTGNPQISFFKSVYRKYTRFSMEHIKEEAETSKLAKTKDTVTFIKVPRNADLVSGMYLEFTLPSIYSGRYNDTVYNYNFKWVENIASALIKSVSLIIGGTRIDTISGEWMDIYYELASTVDEKLIGRKLSGNIPELYEPENGAGQNGVYPHIVSGNQHTRFDSSGFNIEKIGTLSATSTNIPSISGNTYRVPLPFWFSGNSGSALPLIALQYQSVELEVTLAPIYDLYTVLEVDSTNTAFGKRVKATSQNESRLGIENFIIDSSFVSVSGGSRSLTNFDINLQLENTYVFLDDAERKRFAVYEHEYLITQHDQVRKQSGVSENTYDMEINGINPIKYLVIVPRRADSKNRNDHFNYTNWIYPEIPPSSFEYSNKDKFYDNTASRVPFFTHGTGGSTTSDFIIANLKNNIIDKATLTFNGNNRFAETSYQFFEFQQPLQHFKRDKKRGIYLYSFSIDPLNDQPSGACNFSTLINVNINFKLNIIASSEYTNSLVPVDLVVYLVNYNVLKFVSGSAGLVYTN